MTKEEILSLLTQESLERKKRTGMVRVIIFCMLALTAASVGYLMATGKADTMTLITTFTPMLALVGASAGLSVKGKEALIQAASLEDPSVAKHLIEALDSGDAEVVALAKETLASSLPQLPMESLAELDEEHRALLRVSLMNLDPKLGPAAADTLARLGDRDSLSVLENARDSKASPQPLKNAATRALPDLRINLARTIIEKSSQEQLGHQESSERS